MIHKHTAGLNTAAHLGASEDGVVGLGGVHSLLNQVLQVLQCTNTFNTQLVVRGGSLGISHRNPQLHLKSMQLSAHLSHMRIAMKSCGLRVAHMHATNQTHSRKLTLVMVRSAAWVMLTSSSFLGLHFSAVSWRARRCLKMVYLQRGGKAI